MTIRIDNLTAKQKLLMDILWSMDDMSKVNAFIKALPLSDARDAQALVTIAMYETYEQEGEMDKHEATAARIIATAARK